MAQQSKSPNTRENLSPPRASAPQRSLTKLQQAVTAQDGNYLHLICFTGFSLPMHFLLQRREPPRQDLAKKAFLKPVIYIGVTVMYLEKPKKLKTMV